MQSIDRNITARTRQKLQEIAGVFADEIKIRVRAHVEGVLRK